MPEVGITLNAADINKISYWTIKLSDGRVIVENFIPGIPTAWSRLRKYLDRNKDIKILEFSLTFDEECIIIPETLAVDGYFFSGRSEGILGLYQMDFRGIGYVLGNKVYVTWIRPRTQFTPYGIQQEILDYKEGDPRVIMN